MLVEVVELAVEEGGGARWMLFMPSHHLILFLEDMLTHYSTTYASNFKVLFSLGFFTKTLYAFCVSLMESTCPFHLILLDFYHLSNIWWGFKIVKFLTMWFSPVLCYFLSSLGPDISHSTMFLNVFFLNVTDRLTDFYNHIKQTAKLTDIWYIRLDFSCAWFVTLLCCIDFRTGSLLLLWMLTNSNLLRGFSAWMNWRYVLY